MQHPACMALKPWWEGDPAQRYWMEVTDRLDTGDNLVGPPPEWGCMPELPLTST